MNAIRCSRPVSGRRSTPRSASGPGRTGRSRRSSTSSSGERTKRTSTPRAGSAFPRTSASTPGSAATPSSSAPMTASSSGSPTGGTPASRRSKGPSATASRTSGSSDGRVHEPVLLAEVLAQLAPREGGRFLDGTVGGGGHAAALLDATAPDGRLLGLDVDPAALAIARRELARFGGRAVLVQSNFAVLDDVARERDFVGIDGVLLDLGLSSIQLADGSR